jgi:hypothetical protein
MVEQAFPYLEDIIVHKVNWLDFNDYSKSVCLLILRCLQAASLAGYDSYFSEDRFKVWMLFAKKVLDIDVSSELLRKPSSWFKVVEMESHIDWKIKRMSSGIICR